MFSTSQSAKTLGAHKGRGLPVSLPMAVSLSNPLPCSRLAAFSSKGKGTSGNQRDADGQADPDKERTDRIITRWLKRHLHRLGPGSTWIGLKAW